MKRKFYMFVALMCFAFLCHAQYALPRWYGNNHFKITQKEDMVSVAMSKQAWESFSVNLNDIISVDGFLSFEVKSTSDLVLRVDGFTVDHKQIQLFNEHITAGDFTGLFYSISSLQAKIDHLIIYADPGKKFNGEVQFKGLKSVAFLDQKVAVFPNPARENVKVHLPNKDFTEVLLYDNAGNLLHGESANGDIVTFNLQDQKPGVYIIKAKSQNSIVNTKIIKE